MGLQQGGASADKGTNVLLEGAQFCLNHGIPDYPETVHANALAFIAPFLYSCHGLPAASMSGWFFSLSFRFYVVSSVPM